MAKPEMVIAIDTREQRPYQFERSKLKTLSSGDYSIVNLENLVAIERKTTADMYKTIGSGRQRFQRELERLEQLDYAAVVIEASLPDFLVPPAFSRLSPKSAIGTVVAWSIKYAVPFYFASDRRHGQALTRNLLKYYYRYHEEARLVG